MSVTPENLAYCASKFAEAFRASRLNQRKPGTADPRRRIAVNVGAKIALGDTLGTALDIARDMASTELLAQDFRHSAISLFLDDLVHDAAVLAREERAAAGV